MCLGLIVGGQFVVEYLLTFRCCDQMIADIQMAASSRDF